MFKLFKKKKKKMLNMVQENGMYKVYDGEKLLIWGTDLKTILEFIKDNSEE